MLATSPASHSVSDRSDLRSALRRFVWPFDADIALLKGLTWRRTAYTVLAAAGFALYGTFGYWVLAKSGWNPRPGSGMSLVDKGLIGLIDFRVFLCLFVSQMLALTVADNLRISWIPRTVVLIIALVVGTALGSAIAMTTGPYAVSPPVWGLTWGGLLALIYFKRRRDEELAAALHATQLAQAELKKKALGSRLQLMQAQVEPQFLFNTLRRIGDLYESDRSSGDRMLENLIVYLRAALPQMRTTSSTLGQEVQLVQAYLNIERLRTRNQLDSTFEIPAHLTPITFPPMVLLPLVEALALRGRNAIDESEALRVEAFAQPGVLKLTVAVTRAHDSKSASNAVEAIRSRLVALYGDTGRLRVEMRKPSGAVAAVELPHAAI